MIGEIKNSGFVRQEALLELAGRRRDRAIAALGVAVLAFVLLGWMLWPR